MLFECDARPGGNTVIGSGPLTLIVLGAVVLASATANVEAHGVDYRIERGQAIVVHFSSHHETAMAGAGFRVFSPDGQRVLVSGKTDVHGRAVFVPDAPGNWRLLMASEDGHGAEVEIVVDEHEAIGDSVGESVGKAARGSPGSASTVGRLSATAAGVGYLLGFGGLLALWRRRR